MIIIEVLVPSFDNHYELKVDENVVLAVMISEIAAIICQKEQCKIIGSSDNLLLFSLSDKRLLSMNLSLYDNNVRTGDRLVLV